MRYTTLQVAQTAHISVQSVRNWTRDYADLLSPEGRGESGVRQFSQEDLQLICTIASLRKSGVPASEIRNSLSQAQPPVIDVAPNATPQQPPTTAQEAPQGVSPLTLVQSSMDQQQRLTEARVRALERQLNRSLWTHFVAFYLGVVTMGLLFYLVWFLVYNLP